MAYSIENNSIHPSEVLALTFSVDAAENLKTRLSKKNIINGDNKNFYKIQDTSIFTLVKVSKKCDRYLSNQIDNVNAIRLLLSCATDQKVKLLETKSFIEIDRLPKSPKLFRKIFLIN